MWNAALEREVSEMDSFWWWQDTGCEPAGGWLTVSGATGSERRDQEDKACAPPNTGLRQRYCFLPSEHLNHCKSILVLCNCSKFSTWVPSFTYRWFYNDHNSCSFCIELEQFLPISSVGDAYCLIQSLFCPALCLSLLSLTNTCDLPVMCWWKGVQPSHISVKKAIFRMGPNWNIFPTQRKTMSPLDSLWINVRCFLWWPSSDPLPVGTINSVRTRSLMTL